MSDESSTLGKLGWFALKTAGISAAVLGGVAVAVPAMGFTAGGVAAGSLAAAYQSAFLGGTIVSGSTFAILQSVGAAGLAAGTKIAVVGGSAVVAALHTAQQKENAEPSNDLNKPFYEQINSCSTLHAAQNKDNTEPNNDLNKSLYKPIKSDSSNKGSCDCNKSDKGNVESPSSKYLSGEENDNSSENEDGSDTNEEDHKKVGKKNVKNQEVLTSMETNFSKSENIQNKNEGYNPENYRKNFNREHKPSINPNGIEPQSIENIWKDVHLSDDMTITNLIKMKKIDQIEIKI